MQLLDQLRRSLPRSEVLSREHLLARVGNRYESGPRTVDIHVRRLRAKLGETLPLELRGSGYKLRAPHQEEKGLTGERADQSDAVESDVGSSLWGLLSTVRPCHSGWQIATPPITKGDCSCALQPDWTRRALGGTGSAMGGLKLAGRAARAGVLRAAPLALFLAFSGCNYAQKSAPPAVAVKAPEPEWQTGTRYFYGTTLASKLSVAGASTVAFSMSAEVMLEARRVGASTEFVARVTQAKFQTEMPAAQPQFDQLATELDVPFGFATINGKLSAVQLPAAWSPFASSIARTLAAAFQFVPRPDQQTGASWKAREIDSTGTFDVEYTPGSGQSIATHKLSYSSISLGKIALANFNATVTPEVLESKGSVQLGVPPTGPRLVFVEYREKLRPS